MSNMPTFTFIGKGKEVEIYNAILNHDVTKFRELLSGGYNPEKWFDFEEWHYCDGLMHAVDTNFREGIEILLRETNMFTRFGFIEACKKKDDDIIRLFFQIACERQRCWAEYLLILLAHENVDMAREFILMDGYNVDDQELYLSEKDLRCHIGREGQSPLHVSAVFQQPQLLELLIQRGGNLDIKDAGDYTPLYAACLHGSYECCQCLLKHGANPTLNHTTKQCGASSAGPRSSLYALCQLSEPPANEKIIGLLLSSGLDMNKERWILYRSQRRCITDDTLRQLMSLSGIPSSLEIICVRAIRLHLSVLTRGRSILARVHQLPVSPLLKARLIVSDFDQGLWLSSPTL